MTSRRILVVDDEESVRWALSKALERAGYRVDLAADGPTGLAAADVSAGLRGRGVLINPINQRCLRAVTHYDVDRAQCAQAVEMVAESVAAGMTAAKPS